VNNVRMILVGVLLVALSPGWAGAQSGHNLFQQALMQERTYGNLTEAIRLYERIALEFTEDRALTATALVNLGNACEKLGVPGAQDAYRRIVEEFPDQAEQARTAVARLGVLVGPRESEQSVSASQDPTVTLLLDEAPGTSNFARRFDLSPDGRQLVLASKRHGPPGIYITDRLGDRPRLIRETKVGERSGLPRWSPDGTMIAVQDIAENGAIIIDPDGNLITRVYFSEETADLAWNPDQQSLTYSIKNRPGGFRSVTLDGRETILAEIPGRISDLGGYSPDGRWLAAGALMVPATGGPTSPIKGPTSPIKMGRGWGGISSPDWGPDGSFYFLSNRSRNRNVWRVEIDPQSGEAMGEPEQVTFFKDADVEDFAVAQDAGNMAYVLTRRRSTVWTAPSNELDGPRALARGVNPIISPDGATVYFEGEGPGNDAVFSVPTSGGTPRRLTPEAHSVRPGGLRMLPDGSRLIYWADLGGPPSRERAYFHIGATGGEPVRLPVPGEARDAPEPSPDGSTLAFAPPSGGLFVVPFEGGEPTRIAEVNGGRFAWSRDGRYVAVADYEPANDTYQVVVVPSEGGEARRLVTEDAQWGDPEVSWHPDGQRVSYVKNGTIWIAYLDGRATTPFYDEPETWAWEGRWAPDGETFFNGGGNGGLYRRNPDGTSEWLWGGPGDRSRSFGYPSISADGRTWVWSTRVGSKQMWMMEGFK